MLVYDNNSNPQTWEWLTRQYGALEVLKPVGSVAQFEIVEVRESKGPASITAMVLDESGNPLHKVAVAFSWPDAPVDLTTSDAQVFKSRWRNRAVVQWTGADGHTGFGMGSGSYYYPPVRGPHAIWVLHNLFYSQALDGLGMLSGTDHWTVGRIVFKLKRESSGNGSNGGNGGGEDVAAVVSELKSLNTKMQKLSEHLGVR